MAKLKMLKLPKKPKLGKKPSPNASLATKQSWLNRKNDIAKKWFAKCDAVKRENQKRKSINEASEKASTIISGIGDITEVRPSSFSAKIVRARRKSKISGVKKRRKKAAPRKTARKRRR